MRIIILYCLSLICLNQDITAQTDSIPIGRVVYVQQVNLLGDNDRNGMASLYFNADNSEYIHHGVPLESYTESTGDFSTKHVSGDPKGFPVYKMHRARKIFSRVPCYYSARERCITIDTLGDTAWSIHPQERKRLGSYECRKATGEFGGRMYEVWFTLDIPVSTGPYKLGGLPGLILEARTLDNKVQFLFSSIEISPALTHLILAPEGNRTGMSYAQHVKARNEHVKNVVKEFKAKGMEVSAEPVTDLIELVDLD